MLITTEHQKRTKEFYNDLVDKAIKNEVFKQSLIENPRKAITEFSNGNDVFSDKFAIVVEDQSAKDVIYLNIPQRVNVEDFELSESQLSMVSGGGKPEILLAFGPIGWCMYAGFKTAEYLDK